MAVCFHSNRLGYLVWNQQGYLWFSKDGFTDEYRIRNGINILGQNVDEFLLRLFDIIHNTMSRLSIENPNLYLLQRGSNQNSQQLYEIIELLQTHDLKIKEWDTLNQLVFVDHKFTDCELSRLDFYSKDYINTFIFRAIFRGISISRIGDYPTILRAWIESPYFQKRYPYVLLGIIDSELIVPIKETFGSNVCFNNTKISEFTDSCLVDSEITGAQLSLLYPDEFGSIINLNDFKDLTNYIIEMKPGNDTIRNRVLHLINH